MLKILKNIVLQDRLTRIRRDGLKSTHFRALMAEIGSLLGYEFASTMEIESVNLKTPLGTANGIKIKNLDDVVVVSVLRAAIPMVEGMMKVFSEAQYGVVGAWREDEPPFKVEVSYIKIPDINDKIVIIADPMLATGNTMNAILENIKKQGKPQRLAIFNIIATEEGVEQVLENHSEVEIYTCSIENKLENGYIVPGLGDAGDIAFGRPND
jgi:uracil phosphoribosyltransferase